MTNVKIWLTTTLSTTKLYTGRINNQTTKQIKTLGTWNMTCVLLNRQLTHLASVLYFIWYINYCKCVFSWPSTVINMFTSIENFFFWSLMARYYSDNVYCNILYLHFFWEMYHFHLHNLLIFCWNKLVVIINALRLSHIALLKLTIYSRTNELIDTFR